MTKPLIIANWKCNPTALTKAKQLFGSTGRGIRGSKKTEVVICPPFLYLLSLKSLNLNLKVGAQDVFWENKGAYTGEISALMLKDIGCKYVIIGHSERRRYFKETDEMINKKMKAVLRAGLNPILCIGETKEEKREGKTKDVLAKQLSLAFQQTATYDKPRPTTFVVAYEPIWAIGSGNSCDPKEAKKTGLLIRKIISVICGVKIAKKVRLLYGGSVNSKNARDYIKEAGFDGLLVGGASLKAKEFVKIIRLVSPKVI